MTLAHGPRSMWTEEKRVYERVERPSVCLSHPSTTANPPHAAAAANRWDRQIDRYVFSRMRRSVTAESIPTKFCTSIPWGDIVIH